MDEREIEKVFHFVDEENKGFLDKTELKIAYLCLFGFKISSIEIKEILRKCGSEFKNGKHKHYGLNKIDFVTLVTNRFKSIDEDEQIREIFNYFDARCKGFIDFKDFKRAVHMKLKHFDDNKLIRCFRELDRNIDGRVSFADFQLMMRTKI